MKYLVVPQVYTIIAFGASIFLWLFLSRVAIIPSIEGMPLYLIHPLFTLEFFLMLSTAIVWFIAFLFSLYNLRKQTLRLIEIVRQNLFVVSLVLTTVVEMPRTCKICADKCWILIDYLRLTKGYTYSRLIKGFDWKIDNLNKANLSNHFNNHVEPYEIEMFKDLEKFEPFPPGLLEFMLGFREKWLKEKNRLIQRNLFMT